MAITKAFDDAVQSNDVEKIRIMMKNSLINDPSGKEFDEMEKRAVIVPNLIVDFDNGELNLNSNDWDENYLDSQNNILIDNFSRKRIDHVKEIVRNLYHVQKTHETIRKPEPAEDQTNTSISSSSGTSLTKNSGNVSSKKTASDQSRVGNSKTISSEYTNGGGTSSQGGYKGTIKVGCSSGNDKDVKVIVGAAGGAIAGGVIMGLTVGLVGPVIAGAAIGGVAVGFLTFALAK